MKDTAICTYIDNDKDLIEEFGWLYKSWLYSGSWQESDIVAFHHPGITDLPVNSGVKYIPISPISETDEKWKNYPFINSVWYLTTPQCSEVAGYKYILRTDNDCFLTPNFKNFKPRLATFGTGLFANHPSVPIRLYQIAEKWDLYSMSNNVGSTIMAFSSDVIQYTQVQFQLCERLDEEEFTDGPGEWPGWFHGVLSMYAGQLAAASFFGNNMTLGGLDVHCMAHSEISENDYHIHAFHTYDHFSKFNWRSGAYDNFDMSILDRNKISDYCLWIASEAK